MSSDYDSLTLLAERYRLERPGLILIGVEDAAIPVTWIAVDVLAQERKRFAILDEFVLRSIKEGLDSEVDIASILGLKDMIIQRTVADLMGRDLVRRRMDAMGNWQISLSPEGFGAASDLESVTPKKLYLGYAFDRLGWCATAFPRSALMRGDEVKVRGLRKLLGRPGEISVGDVPPSTLNALINDEEGRDAKVEILNVKRVSIKSRMYLPAVILSYLESGTNEIQTAIAIDGEFSQSHELELNKLGGAEAIGIRPAANAAYVKSIRPPSGVEFMEIDQVELCRSAILRAHLAQFDGTLLDQTWEQEAEEANRELDGAKTRAIAQFEFPQLLEKFLKASRREMMIKSPKATDAVVNPVFLAWLEKLLAKNVLVTIILESTQISDPSALSSLKSIASNSNFTLLLLGNEFESETILMSDGKLVVSDFNWLSFKGDHDRLYSLVSGYITTERAIVDRYIESAVK